MSLSKPVFKFLSHFWPIAKWMNPLFRREPFGRIFAPAYSSTFNQEIILPIRQDIPIPASSILPLTLLERLVEESAGQVVMNSCLCRTVQGCIDYPLDQGCLFLGEGADRIHSSMARKVSREEALAHIKRGAKLGLSPTIIHSWFDAAILGIPYKNMLAICFCCPCCCTLQESMSYGPQAFKESLQPIPGIKVEVTPECVGCGICVESCNFDAIELHSPAAIISNRCKACGRCVQACPNQAIRIDIETSHQDIEHLLSQIRSHTQIG